MSNKFIIIFGLVQVFCVAQTEMRQIEQNVSAQVDEQSYEAFKSRYNHAVNSCDIRSTAMFGSIQHLTFIAVHQFHDASKAPACLNQLLALCNEISSLNDASPAEKEAARIMVQSMLAKATEAMHNSEKSIFYPKN